MPSRSDELLAVVLAATNDGLWDWDLTTDRCSFSPRWKAMLGYEPHEISDCFEEWRFRVHPDDLGQALGAVEAYLAGDLPQYEVEHRLRHKDGGYRWICARGAALRDADGKAPRFVGFHSDVSDRKRAEQELVEQRRALATLLDNLPGMAYRCRNDPDLIVGVAAVGVIAFRSVVERRRQIGVLRALGYQRGLVARSFVIESAFVVALGVVAGASTGLLPAYNLMHAEDFGGSGDIEFLIPWALLAVIIAATIAAALLMAWLPARQAARIALAEALRYE